MAELPDAGEDQRNAVCEALADAVIRVEPAPSQLRIVRDRPALVGSGGSWEVTHDPAVFHTCEPPVAPLSAGDASPTRPSGAQRRAAGPFPSASRLPDRSHARAGKGASVAVRP